MDDQEDPSLTPIIPYNNTEFEDLDSFWFESLHLVEPQVTTSLRNYLAGLAQSLIDKNGLQMPVPRFLISDDPSINAGVLHEDTDNPIVFVTTGGIDFVQSEDELLGVIGHELGHIEVKKKTKASHNSRPEEIGADGYSALWLIGAGRNWRAAQNFFKRLAQKEDELREGRRDIYFHVGNFLDVHSRSIDRVQYIETLVGAKAIRESKIIDEPPFLLVPTEILEAAKSAQHSGHVKRRLEGQGYSALPTVGRIELLLGLDRIEHDGRFVPADLDRQYRYSADHQKQEMALKIEVERAAIAERRKEYAEMMLEEIKNLNPAQTNDLSSLIDQIIDRCGLFLSRSKHQNDNTYRAPVLNFKLYNAAHNVLHGEHAGLKPLGSLLKTFDRHINRLVTASDYETAQEAAENLLETITPYNRMFDDISNMRNRLYSNNREKLETVFLFRRLQFSNFKPIGEGGLLPWERHITWMAQAKDEKIACALWMLGVNTDRRLWGSLDPQNLLYTTREWNLTQPHGSLAQMSLTPSAAMEIFEGELPIEEISKRLKDTPKQKTTSVDKEEKPDWFLVDEQRHAPFKEWARHRLYEYKKNNQIPAPDFRPGYLAEDLKEYFKTHETLLAAPLHKDVLFGQENQEIPPGETWEENFVLHLDRTRVLFDGIIKVLQKGNPQDRKAMYNFLLEINDDQKDRPVLRTLVRRNFLQYSWDSPLIEFIMQDRFDLFKPDEKAYLLFRFTPCDDYLFMMGADTAEARRVFRLRMSILRDVFGYTKPETIDELFSIPEKLNLPDDPWQIIRESKEEMNNRFGSDTLSFFKSRYGWFSEEVRLYLDENKMPFMSEDFAAFCRAYQEKAKGLSHIIDNRLGDMLIDRMASADLSVPNSLLIDDLIDIYKTLNAENFFPNTESMVQLSDTMLARIEGEDNLERRLSLYERLLFVDPVPEGDREQSHNFEDFIMAEKAIRNWSRDIASVIGIDPGGEEFCNTKLSPIVDRVMKQGPERDRFLAFRVLADDILAQRESCHMLKTRLKQEENLTVRYDLYVRATETILNFIREKRENRSDTLNYLMGMSDGSDIYKLTDNFMTWINGDDDKEDSDRKRLICMHMNIISGEEFMADRNMFADPVKSAEADQKLYPRILDMLKHIHRFFWSRPVEARAIVINNLLISSEDLGANRDAALKDAQDMTVACLFNEEKADPKDALQNRWARSFLSVYLENAQESERGLIMGALLSASQITGINRKQASFGERLANLLGMMGPAFYKLGQAVHSHPQTREDIRQPMARLKSLGEKIPRWDYFSLIDGAVPETQLKKFQWVGDIVGRASFFNVGPVTMADGSQKMLGTLDENAAQKADYGFDRIEKCTLMLAEREPEFRSISRVMLSMVRQARDLARVETDMTLGASQNLIMMRQHSGLHIAVGEHVFDFAPMEWLSYGDRFKLMEIAHGVHFDELPETNFSEQSYKNAIAKAVSYSVIKNIVKGEYFDHDRHERQMRIQGLTLGMFDPGGIIRVLPKPDERKMLGRALGAVIPAALNNKEGGQDIAHLFTEYLSALETRTGSCPDYLMRVQMAMLAQNGFHRHLNAGDLQDILSTLIRERDIDLVIGLPLVFAASASNWSGLAKRALKSLFNATPIRVWQDKVPPLSPPLYIPAMPLQKKSLGASLG